jgi:hypothetical protein
VAVSYPAHAKANTTGLKHASSTASTRVVLKLTQPQAGLYRIAVHYGGGEHAAMIWSDEKDPSVWLDHPPTDDAPLWVLVFAANLPKNRDPGERFTEIPIQSFVCDWANVANDPQSWHPCAPVLKVHTKHGDARISSVQCSLNPSEDSKVSSADNRAAARVAVSNRVHIASVQQLHIPQLAESWSTTFPDGSPLNPHEIPILVATPYGLASAASFFALKRFRLMRNGAWDCIASYVDATAQTKRSTLERAVELLRFMPRLIACSLDPYGDMWSGALHPLLLHLASADCEDKTHLHIYLFYDLIASTDDSVKQERELLREHYKPYAAFVTARSGGLDIKKAHKDPPKKRRVFHATCFLVPHVVSKERPTLLLEGLYDVDPVYGNKSAENRATLSARELIDARYSYGVFALFDAEQLAMLLPFNESTGKYGCTIEQLWKNGFGGIKLQKRGLEISRAAASYVFTHDARLFGHLNHITPLTLEVKKQQRKREKDAKWRFSVDSGNNAAVASSSSSSVLLSNVFWCKFQLPISLILE